MELPKWRGTVGINIDRRRHDLDLYYRLDVPVPQPAGPARAMVHIIGLGYRVGVKAYAAAENADSDPEISAND